MSEIAASERRLSAALDRIDQLLEAGTARPAPAAQPDDSDLTDRLDEALAENARLATEIAALREHSDGPLEVALAETRNRLAGATDEAARLAAANEELAESNRKLIEARDQVGDEATETVQQALEAEIEALRAARAAEIAQMSDLVIELERLLTGHDEPGADDTVRPEAMGDGAGVPEDGQDERQGGL